MGIKNLSQLILDAAPQAVKENEFQNYFGRKVAVDASMSLYQFLIAVRQEGVQLTDASGETTSHLSGFFYRTIRMVESGIKPVYVFDGKPPSMKSGELEKRKERRDEAQKSLEIAQEAGDKEEIDKQARRLVKVSASHNEEAQKLLTLMGIPFIKAPCEAEAQCAVLQKTGKVYGVATEDMDALTFGTKILLRHLTFSEARKLPIQEFHLDKVLEGLELNMNEFIDLCILLGCDYCDSIRGIGPKKAKELIEEYRTIENVLEYIERANAEYIAKNKKKNPEVGPKFVIPENWPYEQARELFKNPEVADADEMEPLKWEGPDEAGLIAYMVEEKGFALERIKKGCEKLKKAKGTSTQGRLDGFFTVIGTTAGAKRPADPKNDKKNAQKKGRGGGSGARRGGR